MSSINRSYRVISFALAMLMLCSSFSYSVSFHYCKGELMGLSILGPAKSCHEGKASCPRHKEMVDEDDTNNCCTNSDVVIDDLDQDYMMSQSAELTQDNIDFLIAYLHSFVSDRTTSSAISTYKHYRPPLPAKDIPVLYQVFRI